MASFALYMARAGLKYGTLQGYVWAICEYHIQLGGIVADPLDNVQDWARFMSALEVQSWVDSSVEPHEMVPFQLFVRTLRALDVPVLDTPSAAAAPSVLTCSARAASKARVTEVPSYPLASIRGPEYDAAHGSSSVWRLAHCESSMCIYDKGHDGPHSHDVVAGKRGR